MPVRYRPPMCRFFVLSVALLLASCSSDDSSHEQAEPTAQSAAEVLRTEISDITELLPIDEDNDPNNLIGRPNGYTAATIVFDSRISCPADDPGVDCGATIEEWPSKEAAEARAEYIQTLLAGSPILGSEWDTVRGNLLLRVSGALKPSDAKVYEQIFRSEDLAANGSEQSDGESSSTESAMDAWLAELATTGLKPRDPVLLWNHIKSTTCASDDYGLYVTLSRGDGMSLSQERVGLKHACPDRLDDWDAAIVELGETTDRVDYLCETPLEDLSLDESDSGISDREEAMIVCDQYQGPEWNDYYEEHFAP